MNDLLYKELRLSLTPQAIAFFILGIVEMAFPTVPRYVPIAYATFGIGMIFINATANNDESYTVLLPIAKKDLVKARFLLVALYEICAIVLSVPFNIIAAILSPEGNPNGCNGTVACYGLIFAVVSLYNVFFLSLCFRKANNRCALEIIVGSLIYIAAYMLCELPVILKTQAGIFISSRELEVQVKQIPILAGGIVLWVLMLLVSYKIAVKKISKVDL